jgi:hypothetical protein
LILGKKIETYGLRKKRGPGCDDTRRAQPRDAAKPIEIGG